MEHLPGDMWDISPTNTWVRFLPPRNEFVLLDSGLASKDMQRDVITLNKYTKEEE